MILLAGLFIICVVVAVTIARRKTRERAEEAANDRDDFQALMEHDLKMMSHQQAAAPNDTPDTEISAKDHAFIHDFQASEPGLRPPSTPMIFHDCDTEALVLLWDGDARALPPIHVYQDTVSPHVWRVMIGETLVARVSCDGALRPEDIRVVPHTMAQALGVVSTAA